MKLPALVDILAPLAADLPVARLLASAAASASTAPSLLVIGAKEESPLRTRLEHSMRRPPGPRMATTFLLFSRAEEALPPAVLSAVSGVSSTSSARPFSM